MASNIKKRMPLDEVFLHDKKVSDLVYGKMQVESKFIGKGEPRMLETKKINKKKWAEELGISRPTLDTKIKYLKKVKLIVDKGEHLELPEFGKRYFLIPDDTLRFLVNTTNGDVIKVYSHLGALWAMKGYEAGFTQNQLLEMLGYSKTSAASHKKIRDILDCLENNGLISTIVKEVGVNKVQFLVKFSNTHKTNRK